MNRRRLLLHTAIIVVLLLAARLQTTQRILVANLVEFAVSTQRLMHFPCWALAHTRCLSLDRLDPTCPQCL